MMIIRMLYGPRFQCARMGGGYSPLMMNREPIGSNNAYFRSPSALQFRGRGDGQTPVKVIHQQRNNISPHFSSFLLISLHNLHLSEDIKRKDFCGALGQRKCLLNNIFEFFITVSKKELKKPLNIGIFWGKNANLLGVFLKQYKFCLFLNSFFWTGPCTYVLFLSGSKHVGSEHKEVI